MKTPHDYSGYDDPALMSLIAHSQEGALAQLYDRYSRLVFSLAFAIVQERATAEEITLDVFMRVWQKAVLYRPELSKVSTWLTHITRNHAIDVLRRQASRPEQSASLLEEELPQTTSAGKSPAESAEDSLRRERIRVALGSLPPDQKQVIQMAYFEGYTQTEIAETLHQPLGTVKTRVRLAMQKLRELLRGEQADTSADLPSAYSMRKEQ